MDACRMSSEIPQQLVDFSTSLCNNCIDLYLILIFFITNPNPFTNFMNP